MPASVREPTVGVNLRNTLMRQKTFDRWPGTSGQVSALAENGFYYTGEGDMVRCAYCGIQLDDWRPSNFEQVKSIHGTVSPRCDFLRVK